MTTWQMAKTEPRQKLNLMAFLPAEHTEIGSYECGSSGVRATFLAFPAAAGRYLPIM
jgi:hypothetical protein